MRPEYLTAVLAWACLTWACGEPHLARSTPAPDHDPTTESWYGKASGELTGISREAWDAYRAGKSDDAGKLVERGEEVASRLLAVPRPTLSVAEATSDLDELYGRMLFGNKHYGWARLQFQKNLARWKRWKPETEDTQKRLKNAQSEIDECDRKISAGL